MQKNELTSFVDILGQADVKEFSIRYEDGSRVSVNNEESTIVRFAEDGAYIIETDENYMSAGPFNIRKVCYDDIASIQSRGLTVSETLKIVEALGLMDDAIKGMISKRGAHVRNVPAKSGYGAVTDEEGNNILSTGMVGRVTTGYSK